MAEQSSEDASHDYFIDLLTLALQRSGGSFASHGVSVKNFDGINHESLLRLIQIGEIDVIWTGTNGPREELLLPVRVPLMRGLLGYRVSLMHKRNLALFERGELSELKAATACQGKYWPDADILEKSGFAVNRIGGFPMIFKLLDSGRCDYFPRAIFEGHSEHRSAVEQYPDLILFDDIMLHYDFPIYFFVARDNVSLAKALEDGLKNAIHNGEFDQLMRDHPVTQHLFPLTQWRDKTFIHLHNHTLPKATPLDDSSLWLRLH